VFAGLVSCFSTDQKKLKRLECRTETFTYTSDESTLSRKAESAGEISEYARAVRNLSLLEMPVGVSMKQEAPLLVAGMKSHHETVDIIR